MKYAWEVQHTGGPFAGAGPQADDWRRLSRHETFTAAAKRWTQERREMSEACGQGGWSNHFRVVEVATGRWVDNQCLSYKDHWDEPQIWMEGA